jgi:hypothetical protein
VEVMRKHGRVIALRHLVPGVFVAALPACIAASLAPPPFSIVGIAPLAAYGALLGSLAFSTTMRERDIKIGLGAAVAAMTMHVGYGLGTLAAAISPRDRGGTLSKLMTRLTR